MKTIHSFFYGLVVLLISACHTNSSRETNQFEQSNDINENIETIDTIKSFEISKVIGTKNTIERDTTNSAALKKVIVKMYEWNNEDNFYYNQMLVEKPNDSIYEGFDMNMLTIRLNKLNETYLFSERFLNQYKYLILSLDKKLRSGEYKWYIGDLEEDGPDANLWCLCQDTPSDDYNDIVITILEQTETQVTIAYSWFEVDNEGYQIKLSKENNSWKIDYLEGFDPINFRDLK